MTDWQLYLVLMIVVLAALAPVMASMLLVALQ